MKLAIGGAAGTVGLVALQQRQAGAVCTAANCPSPNFCCPDTPFGDAPCATPEFPQCCGTTTCASAPSQQCCPGTDPFNPAERITAPFCVAGQPPNIVCCGAIACTAASVCVAANCCAPLGSPAGTTCCGQQFCAPGTVCVQYPPGTFQCAAPCGPGNVCPGGFTCEQGGCIPVAVLSDRNIKENVVPVAW